MSPTLANTVSQVPDMSKRNFLKWSAVASIMLVTGCASMRSITDAPKKTGLEWLSPDIVAKIKQTEKKAKDALVQYPGTKRGMPNDLIITPYILPGQYLLSSKDVFEKVTKDPIIIDIDGNLITSILRVTLDEDTKNNSFYTNVLNNGYGIYDGDICRLSRDMDWNFIIENTSRDKPIRIAKTEDE